MARSWWVDPFSSAVSFDGWNELADKPPWTVRPDYEWLVVCEPRSWLQCIGWRRHGAIGIYEVPGPHAPATEAGRPRVASARRT